MKAKQLKIFFICISRRQIFICSCFLVSINYSIGQTTMYSEDFNSTSLGKGIDGTTLDMSGITNWTIAYSGSWTPMAAGEYFKVVNFSGGNNCFESFNTDAPGNSPAGAPSASTFPTYCVVWSTPEINSNGYTGLAVSVDLGRSYNASTSGCKAYYSVDGGSNWVEFGSVVDNTGAPDGGFTTYSQTGLCGSTIQIKIAHWGTSSTPKYMHDNVTITGTAVPRPSSHPAAFSANPNSDCTKMDLTFSAANTITNANGYVIIQKQGSLPSGIPTDKTSYSVGNAIGDAIVVAFITGSAVTSATVIGLAGSTAYYYKIFPYYYDGSNSCTYNYYTGGSPASTNNTTGSCVLSPEPSSHPASFSVSTGSTCEQLDLSFSAGSTITNFYGYLILERQGASPTGIPVDATNYSVGNTIGDATVAAKITNSATTSITINGLYDTTRYYFSIFPFNYDGSDPLSHNYLTTGYQNADNFTKYCPVIVGSSTPNSSWDDPNICLHGGNADWWSVNYYDNADLHGETTSKMSSITDKIITSISVDLNEDATKWTGGSPSATLTNNEIYMANYSNGSSLSSEYTTEANLNSGTGVTWTLVYSGNVNFSGYGWNTINLTAPFSYIGTGGLLVKFKRVSGNTPATYPYFGFLDASPTSEIRQLNSTYNSSGSPASYKYLKIAFNGLVSVVGGTGNIVLPVAFLSFEGHCKNGMKVLSWQTASEINNEFFYIEKSLEGKIFFEIGKMPGAGNSSAIKNYSFGDNDLDTSLSNYSYYRLRQEDFDGTSFLSSIITIKNCDREKEDEIVLYPVPASSFLFLSTGSISASSLIELTDQFGKTLINFHIQNSEFADTFFEMDIKDLSPGIYIVKIKNHQQVLYKRFFKF